MKTNEERLNELLAHLDSLDHIPVSYTHLIGKMMHAAELGILLTVSPDSRCLEKDLLLPMEDYITIIGNLLENAIEELSNGEHEIKEITLGLYCDPDCNIITCEDTGGGIRPDLIDRIYERGVSSKGENLSLIHISAPQPVRRPQRGRVLHIFPPAPASSPYCRNC